MKLSPEAQFDLICLEFCNHVFRVHTYIVLYCEKHTYSIAKQYLSTTRAEKNRHFAAFCINHCYFG